MKNFLKFGLILSIILLAACSSVAPVNDTGLTPPALPEAGKATAYGQVLDVKTGEPIVDVIVRLADVHGEGSEGVFLLNFGSSPGTRTDTHGNFIFENIPPGKYVIAIGEGDNLNNYDVIEESGGRAKVWEAKADQVHDWGKVRAELLFK